MKSILTTILVLISFLSSASERAFLNTSHAKKEFVHKIGFSIYYNAYQQCSLIVNGINPAEFNNKFINEEDKVYWLLTESLYGVLKRYAIQGNSDVCLAIWNEGFYKNTLLKISSFDLKKLNDREFNEKDFNSHSIVPVREILETAEIVNVNFKSDTKKIVNNKGQTKKYKNFLTGYSFSNRIERKVEINYKKYVMSRDSIFYNIENGNYDEVKQYIKYKFDVNKKDDENQQTLIQYAAVNGHYSIVKLLLDNGADPNIHNSNVENAYLAAKRLGYIKIVELLEPITIIKTRYTVNTSNSNLNDRCAILSGKFEAWSACMKKESNVFSMGKKGLNAYYAIRRECNYLAGNDNTGLSYLCKNESKYGCIGLKAPQSTIDACYQCNGSNLWLRVYAVGTVLKCY